MKRGNFRFGFGLAWICLPVAILTLSCGGGGGDSGGSGSSGTLSLSLTDASTTDYRAIYVTLKQVEVHKDGGAGWQVISHPQKTYNLLALVNGVRERLALASLASGHYTQMRLILMNTPDDSINLLSRRHPYANYFIDTGGDSIELKVPSGLQTGIKIVRGFDINANQTTELVLDFDALRSIVKAGNSGKWLLKPTIKLLNTKEYSIIEGNAGQEGVLISAQVFNSSAAPLEDQVEVKAATVSDGSGNYKLFLEPGTYALAGYKDGYAVFHKDTKIVTAAGNTYPETFALGSSLMGLATGNVPISGGEPDQYAAISIRMSATFGGTEEKIEIKSLNVANGGVFSVNLPAGSYTAVISTAGKSAKDISFSISGSSTTDLGSVGW